MLEIDIEVHEILVRFEQPSGTCEEKALARRQGREPTPVKAWADQKYVPCIKREAKKPVALQPGRASEPRQDREMFKFLLRTHA